MALTDNLSAYYKLDETSGTRYDSTANNNDLTDNNTVTSEDGKIEKAAVFNSANSESLSITNANQTGLNFTSTFSVSFWVNITTAPSSGETYTFFNKDAANQRSYEIHYTNGSGVFKLRVFLFQTLTATQYEATTHNFTIETGGWRHIVLVVDPSQSGVNKTRLYYNGSDEGVADETIGAGGGATSIADGTAPFEIGRRDFANDFYLLGSLDEIGLWKGKLLTSDEVATLYNLGSGLTYPFTTGTTAVTPSGSLGLLGCGM